VDKTFARAAAEDSSPQSINLIPVVEAQSAASPQSPLIIGYGNIYRQDDGFGWRVIDELKKTGAAFNYIREQQLAPEISEDISRAAFVVFVDASATGTPGTLTCEDLTPNEVPGPHYTHHVAPQDILALAKILYGRAPNARLITMTGKSFELEEGLSPLIESRIPDVIEQIRGYLK
jgi:hydrogenase maturation protease